MTADHPVPTDTPTPRRALPHRPSGRDLRSPLTVIKGHAQLLARDVRCCHELPEAERDRMLARLSIVQCAVDELAAQVADIDGGHPTG